jgi:TonB family protein
MKQLLTILFSMNVLLAESPFVLKQSHPPKPIKTFDLSYHELRSKDKEYQIGNVIVEFIISKDGKVVQPEIVDTFNITFNDVILDKVRQMKFTPPLQNGEPVEVRYKLPIAFK